MQWVAIYRDKIWTLIYYTIWFSNIDCGVELDLTCGIAHISSVVSKVGIWKIRQWSKLLVVMANRNSSYDLNTKKSWNIFGTYDNVYVRNCVTSSWHSYHTLLVRRPPYTPQAITDFHVRKLFWELKSALHMTLIFGSMYVRVLQ